MTTIPPRAPSEAISGACRIPEAGLTCVGCCLYAFAGREATLAAIRANTAALAAVPPGDEAALLRFRDREAPAGAVCGNCVEEAPGVLGCPLHPARTGGRDLRRGHCMADFLCRTAAIHARAWDGATRARFAAFVASRGIDGYEFSVQMVSDRLLAAFEESGRNREPDPPAAA